MRQDETWAQVAAGLITSIPARLELTTQQASGAILAGLAAAFYRLKEGQSVWLSFPSSSPKDLDAAIHYAHQVRLSALKGSLRANAFNRPALMNRTDLVVWTQPSFQYTRLRHDSDLGVQWVRPTRSGNLELAYPNRILRTLLCASSGALTGLCDQLTQHSQPFMHLVDFTAFGNSNDSKALLEHLESYFPSTPILILTDCTNKSIDHSIVQSRRHYSHWKQQIHDNTDWIGLSQIQSEFRLITIPDDRLESLLMETQKSCQVLKEQLHRHPSVAKQLLPMFYRVIRTLRSLAYPLNFHEHYLAAHRRGGLFPSMPLADWLGRAARIDLPTGQAENTRDGITKALNDLLALVLKGQTGKQQALNLWLTRPTNGQSRRVVVTGTEIEAKAMRQWLMQVHSSEMEAGSLKIIGINSRREIYNQIDKAEFDQALVICNLWESDLWCLSLAHTVEWLGYPIENRWQTRLARHVTACQIESSSQKLEWWQWHAINYTKEHSEGPEVGTEQWNSCRGQYESHNRITVSIPEGDDWLEALMAPPLERQSHIDSLPVAGEVTVLTEQGLSYRYHENQNIYILTGSAGSECLESLLAKKLEPGMTLVELEEDESVSQGLFDTLIEYATEESMQFRTYKALVERWYTMVDHAIHQVGSLDAFQRALQRKGVTIGLQQLKNWAAHNVIGPNKSDLVVPAVAQISGANLPYQQLQSIQNAQRLIKGLHTSLGKTLKKIVLASCAPNTTLVTDLSLNNREQQLSQLVRLDAIQAVHCHPTLHVGPANNLELLLRQSVAASNGHLVATNAAYRSAQSSHFIHHQQAQSCFNFLSNELYEVYCDKTRTLDSAVESAKQLQIRFSGDSSNKTKGVYKSTYQRVYQGKLVDIGKHIGIGNSWDPKRCFRVHFHWDPKQKQIVIHHAGEHLPTNQG